MPTESRAKTIAFVGARGGTGTTTIATNVAVAFAHYSRGKAALLDLNVGRTIADQLLDLPPDGGGTFSDLLPVLGELAGAVPDAEVLDQAVVTHPTGLRVLIASRAVDPVAVPEEAVRQTIDGMAARADVVVMDIPSSFDTATFTALLSADRVIVVAVPDVPTLKRTKALIDRLREAKGNGRAGVHVALNQANSSKELSLQQIEDFLGEATWSVLPAAQEEARRYHDRRQIPVLDLGGPLGKALYLTALKLHPMKRLAKPK